MNEYIGANGISFGGPNFTDIFSQGDQEMYYRDSPLSPTGQDQAKALHNDIESLLSQNDEDESNRNLLKQCLQDLELVVVSPLMRAIQTAELAVLPHMTAKQPKIPIVALPLAAERLYLVSDIGQPRSALKHKYGSLVDFHTGFPTSLPWDDPWWFQHSSPSSDDKQQQQQQEYMEWRPTGQGQKYFCPGEPHDAFRQRMEKLCQWLDDRDESRIALVGHFGVFEWLLKDDTADAAIKFGNCEMKVVSLDTILRKAY